MLLFPQGKVRKKISGCKVQVRTPLSQTFPGLLGLGPTRTGPQTFSSLLGLPPPPVQELDPRTVLSIRGETGSNLQSQQQETVNKLGDMD